ncbi:MAG: DNA primase [Bryobacterales bacterium]|nr:DNA primase [Bryobacterales bacterium]
MEAVDFARQVKAAVDIVAVVGEFVRLKRVGATQSYIGLCPFHNEKTPSFRVNGAHQFYKCFGCGQGGDVFKFIQELERLSFPEALRWLAERYGIPMPKRSEFADAETKLRAAIHRMHEQAQDFFVQQLRGGAGQAARAYLSRRGVSDDAAQQFGIGYAPAGGQALVRLLERGEYTAEQLEQGGLVLRRHDGSGLFDRFRNRLMFPIHGETGKVIAFAGRALGEDEPKYLNSSETPIYRKSYVLYNLHRAKEGIRRDGFAVLVEGYMDVIGVFTSGVTGVVATCGTALTAQQVQALKRHTGQIVVNFDPDAAGAAAAERSLEALLNPEAKAGSSVLEQLFAEGMRVRVLTLEGGLDPDEYCAKYGGEAYRSAVERAPTFFYWIADRARTRFDLGQEDGRAQWLEFLLSYLRLVPNDVQRAAVAEDLAHAFGIGRGLVLESFRKAVVSRRERTLEVKSEPVPYLERCLLQLLLSSEEARARFVPELRALPAVARLGSARIFEALFDLHEGGSPAGFAELEARLEEADRHRLAAILLADEHEEMPLLEQGEACLRALAAQSGRARADALRALIREAERTGNLEEALRLAQELDGLRGAGGGRGVQLTEIATPPSRTS